MRMGKISNSSLIKSVGFSGGPGEIGTLRIQFYDATIDFEQVPYRLYKALVLVRNHSAYYLKHIHGQFGYNKLP